LNFARYFKFTQNKEYLLKISSFWNLKNLKMCSKFLPPNFNFLIKILKRIIIFFTIFFFHFLRKFGIFAQNSIFLQILTFAQNSIFYEKFVIFAQNSIFTKFFYFCSNLLFYENFNFCSTFHFCANFKLLLKF
jgi:hypothetical protein